MTTTAFTSRTKRDSTSTSSPSSSSKPTSTADKLDLYKNQDDPATKDLLSMGEKLLEKKIADKVRQWYEKAKGQLTPIRNQWYLNLAFYKGDQYVSLLRGRLVKAPQVPGRVRMTVNRVRPTVRTELSRMTSQKPMASVVPASSEDEDILAAMAGESVWEYVSQTKGFDDAFKQAAFWTSTCGIGYVKTVWDPDCEDKQTNALPDPNAQQDSTVKGDLCYSAPTPFHIFISDIMEQDIQKQSFVLHVYTLPVEEVKERFGDKLDPDLKPSVVSTNEIFETRYLNSTGSENSVKPDSSLVIEAWIKPGATNYFPNGGMAIVVDNTLVYKVDDGMPYDHGDFPFVKIENVPSGSFYSTSVIEDLIPIQKEINRTRSQVVENRNATAKSGYFYQEGAIDPNKWTAKPGALIGVKPGFKEPVPIAIPPLPGYVDKEHENYLRDWEDMSGQHQVSKGNAPSGVTAATAINYLQERDDSFMATVYDSIESATQNAASQTLQICVQYWDIPRLVKAVGKDQSFSTMYLLGADLKNGTDIRIDTGTSLPTSKAAMRAFVTDLMSRGMIPADEGLKMMDMPNMRSYYELVKVDENQAKRENIKMANLDPMMVQQADQQAQDMKQQYLDQQGIDENTARQNPTVAQLLDHFDQPILKVNDFDNHDAHIFFHQNFMKSQRYESMPPVLQEQFEKHVAEHQKMQASKQIASLMQGGTAGGPPPGPPPQMGGGPGGGGPVAKGPNGGPNVQGNNQFSDANAAAGPNPGPAQ